MGGASARDAAAAYPCTPVSTAEVFSSGTEYDYSRCEVPDLDQKRTAVDDDPALGTRLGLPGDGNMWCVPTSTMNWLAYIAAHGFGGFEPGNADWESEPLDFATYNLMTEKLATLGALMLTDAEDGTSYDKAASALKLLFGGAGLLDEFGVLVIADFDWYSPTIAEISGLAVSGALVNVMIGRYKDLKSEAPAAAKQFYPSGLIRVGGHSVSLVGVDAFAGNDSFREGAGTFSFHDPARGEPALLAPYLQSAFTRQSYHVRMDWGGFGDGHGPVLPHLTDYSSSNPNQFIDAVLAIVPKVALSATATQLIVSTPVTPLLTAGVPAEKRVSLPLGRRLLDLAVNPFSTRHPYLLEKDNTIWQLDALTGRSSRLATVGNPRRLVYGGREQKLYVLLKDHVVSLDPQGRERDRVLLPDRVDEIAYDRKNERLVGLSARGDSAFSWDTNLRPQTFDVFPALPCGGGAEIGFDPDGALLLHCPGTGDVFKKPVSSKPPPSTFELRGAPNARGLVADESGKLFAVVDGHIAVFDADGTRLTDSPFAGKPAGDHLDLQQSFSNLDPALLTGPGYHNVLPDDPDPPIEIFRRG